MFLDVLLVLGFPVSGFLSFLFLWWQVDAIQLNLLSAGLNVYLSSVIAPCYG